MTTVDPALRRYAPASATASAQLLAARLVSAGVAAAELMLIQLGVDLGLYDHLAEPVTPATLAGRAGIGHRYAVEWLEQQAVAGIVEVAGDDRGERTYRLPAGHREALIGPASPVPVAVSPITGMAPMLPLLADALRRDAGLPSAAYGDSIRQVQEAMNRSIFDRQLVPWIRYALPDIDERLGRDRPAIADVGCGRGWAAIALAAGFPAARVTGFDLDAGLVDVARRNAVAAGADPARLEFRAQDVSEAAGAGSVDLFCILDALHDMAAPVEVLRACRTRLAPGGCLLLMEPRGAEQFQAPADEAERFLYAVSLLHCLPVSRDTPGSAALGAVLRPGRVRSLAAEAGWRRVTVLPIEHRFYRFYRLD